MSGFSATWLALREPADSAARSAAAWATLPRTADVLDIVDLGAGTGANLRYLAPRLGGPQRWRLVDDDPAVLADARPALRAWAAEQGFSFSETAGGACVEGGGFECEAELVEADLAAGLGRVTLPAGGLVTASALLDLVSAEWLGALAGRCADAEASVLFALTYDGRMHFAPPERGDERVRALVNRHQRGDKGFGPALGPLAGRKTIAAFAAKRYTLRIESTDWRIGPDAPGLQMALLDGWLAAAAEVEPGDRHTLTEWHRRRVDHVERGRSWIVVGHLDVSGSRASPASGSTSRGAEASGSTPRGA